MAVSDIRNLIVGNVAKFDLEVRIINLICFIAGAFSVVALISDIIIGAHWSMISVSLIATLIFLNLYYKARIKFKYNKWSFILLVLLLLNACWFVNAGSKGPTLFVYILAMVGFIIISSQKNHRVVVVMCFLNVLILYCIEFFSPSIILPNLSDKLSKIDTLITFAYTSLFVCFLVIEIKSEYFREKIKVEKLENLERLISLRSQELEITNKNLEKEIERHKHTEKSLKATNIHLNQEIIERKKSEEKLHLMKFGVDHASDGIFWLNSKGNIIYVNHSACKALGYSHEEMLSKNITEIDLKVSAEDWPDRLATIKHKYTDRFESCQVTKDRRSFPVEVTTSYIKFKGEEGVLAFTRDITIRKQVEKEKEEFRLQLLQAQKMESIGNLAGGIAHDFNNILCAIIGMSELLLEDLPAKSTEHENARQVLTAGKRGADLVKQILAFSRQCEHKVIPVRIQHIIKEVLFLTRATIPSNIDIIENVQPDCGLVMADPIQIHQVIMNIITNAYQSIDSQNGCILIQFEEAHFNDDCLRSFGLNPGKYVHLSISDNGCGISEDVINKIFNPYFTTKEQGKGTGLGLSVVYGIVKELKGNINVESKIGKGTTFNIYIPLLDKLVDEISKSDESELPSGSESILIVDDEPSIVNLEKQMFERLGYEVTTRVHSIEALEAFKADPNKYDLVIADQSMPKMTGLQLAAEIKKIKPNVPIIIFTGFNDEITDTKLKTLDINGFLMKPIIKSTAAKLIRKTLDELKSF